jgi:hypothetical protein
MTTRLGAPLTAQTLHQFCENQLTDSELHEYTQARAINLAVLTDDIQLRCSY